MPDFSYRAQTAQVGQLNCTLVLPVSGSDIVQPACLGVFCHGFGAGGDDLVGLAGELLGTMASGQPIALAFPEAPLDLTDQGMPGGRAWWLLSIQRLMSAMEDGRYEQVRMDVPEGIDGARQQLTETIEMLLDRFSLKHDKLLLGGFSQGAMLSMSTACEGLDSPPAALCLYSAALICEKKWKENAARLAATDIVQSHGSQDMILPLQTGIWLQELLQDAGCKVKFLRFNGPHTIPPDAIVETAALLGKLAETDGATSTN